VESKNDGIVFPLISLPLVFYQRIKDQDFIFNLAGQVSHIDSMNDPLTDLEINCTSQLSLLEACRRNNNNIKIIFAGTRQVYGKPMFLPIDETHLLKPVDVNGINKMAGEYYHLVYNKVYGIRSVILRLTNTYGPRQLVKHSRQGFIGWFIRNVVRGEKVHVFGDGMQLRDLNYISDVVEALVAVAYSEESYGYILNLGMDNPISLKDLIGLMIKIFGGGEYELVPFPEEKKKIDIGSIYTDFSKIRDLIGWVPKCSLAEGLMKTFEFYKNYGKYYWD